MKPLRLDRVAEREAAEAFDWYETQLPGLGHRFLDSLASTLERVERGPEAYSPVEGDFDVLVRSAPVLVSARLDDCEEHRSLIARKLETYVMTLGHPDFVAEFGGASPVRILLRWIEEPDPPIKEWLRLLRPSVRSQGAELVVDSRDS